MSTSAHRTSAPLDLEALDAITDAVESGAGLPEVVRAAARTLEASLAVSDRAGHVLAVAARSSSDEASLLADGSGVEVVELRVSDAPVGMLRLRARGELDRPLLRLVATLISSEVERVRAPSRASAEAAEIFLRALIAREIEGGAAVAEGAAELGASLDDGASVIVVRAHAHVAAGEGRRARLLSLVDRAACGVVADSLSALTPPRELPGDDVVVLAPSGDDAAAARVAEAIRGELLSGLTGHTVTIGRSRPCGDPAELHRAAAEALLAVNVAEGDDEHPVLAFEQTGAYRLLLSAMADNPDELQRFYAETVEPLVAYDEQYETDLVLTVETFLEADGNVAGTAQRLFTHRHTVRYRLERVRDLCGHDVGSSDGREKLSLGLKAMRVLGIPRRGGPAAEPGLSAGRVSKPR
ncbi:MAG: helix-turn-helix domain-containing protein [Actinomycetes bacterium]